MHEALQNHVHEAGLAEIQKSASTCAACVTGFVCDGAIVITFTDNRGCCGDGAVVPLGRYPWDWWPVIWGFSSNLGRRMRGKSGVPL